MSNEEKAKTIADKRYPDKSYWIGSGDNARLYDPNATSNRVFIDGYIAATAQLEADKAELVKCLELFTLLNKSHYPEMAGFINQANTLIQKHAAK